MTRRRPSVTSFPCPKCGAKLRAPSVGAGRKVTCYRCGQRVTVPAPPSNRADTVRGDQTKLGE